MSDVVQWADVSPVSQSISRIIQSLEADASLRDDVPAGWREWLTMFFPNDASKPFSEYHARFWEWAWAIERNTRPYPYVAIWPRGAGKSTSAELAAVALLARERRRYVLYVRRKQDLANASVLNISHKLQSGLFANYYPELSTRSPTRADPWNREMLVTSTGAVIQAIGLDTTIRGAKLDEKRPDLIILDDIDDLEDTPDATKKKLDAISKSILPAGSQDVAVLIIQNLIISTGVVAQLADGSADFLTDAIVDGQIPAVYNLTYEWRTDPDTGKTVPVITGGRPSWPEGYDLDVAQSNMRLWGLPAFLSEAQHDTRPPAGGMFSEIEFEHIMADDVPTLRAITVWCDPAVTSNQRSDANGIQADGIGLDNRIYRLYSFEQQSDPETVLKTAIRKAVDLRQRYMIERMIDEDDEMFDPQNPEMTNHYIYHVSVGVETDQGGDVWKTLYHRISREMYKNEEIDFIPRFREAKAGSSNQSKVSRASLMLGEYLNGRFVHVLGTHKTLEDALWRFPLTKPFDLVDSAFWSYHYLDKLRFKRISFA